MDTNYPEGRMTLTLVSFCGRFPVFRTNDGQTHLTLFIDVGMVDFCLECDLWRFERVFRREGELNPKRSLFIRSTVLGTTKKNMKENWRHQKCLTVLFEPIQHLREQ